MNNEEDIDKFIMTSLVEDNLFFNKKLEDEIPGNDYKDIVNRLPRKWIMNKEKMIKNKNNLEKINNINDAMKKFEKEKQIRGNNSFINNNENKNLKSNKNPLGKKTNKNNDIKRNKFRKKMKYRKFKYQDDKDNYYDTKKWNGDMGNMKHLNPEIFYKSKKNYIKLKNELARSIQKELLENKDNDLTQNKEALLEQLFPEMSENQGKHNNKSSKPSLKKKKLPKKQILIKKVHPVVKISHSTPNSVIII